MSTRQIAVIAEIEEQRSFLATRAATLAGELAETKAALTAALAEVEAQRIRAEDAEKQVADLNARPMMFVGDEGFQRVDFRNPADTPWTGVTRAEPATVTITEEA